MSALNAPEYAFGLWCLKVLAGAVPEGACPEAALQLERQIRQAANERARELVIGEDELSLLVSGAVLGHDAVSLLNALRDQFASDRERGESHDPDQLARAGALRAAGTPTLRTYTLGRRELRMLTGVPA